MAKESSEEKKETGKNLETVEEYQSALEDARKDAAKYRTKAKELEESQSETQSQTKKLQSQVDQYQSTMEKLAKAFGEDNEIDPEKLQKERNTLQTQNQQLTLKNTFLGVAFQKQADPDVTYAYLTAKNRLSEVDPGDTDAMEKLIEAAVKEKPSLKVSSPQKVGDNASGGGSEGQSMNDLIRGAAGVTMQEK